MGPITCVFDSGVDPDLARDKLLVPHSEGHIRQWGLPHLYNANNSLPKTTWTIMLHLSFGEAQTRVVFGVVKQLSAPMLLSTSFIDKYFESIFAEEMKIVPY